MANCDVVYKYSCELEHGHELPHVSPLESARDEIEKLYQNSQAVRDDNRRLRAIAKRIACKPRIKHTDAVCCEARRALEVK